MPQMNMIQALNSAMDIMLGRDPGVIVIGEDVGYFGGVFRTTDGLQRKYGEHRVIDAPIAEGGIIGSVIGMGVNGLRPVAEIQFADYIYPGFDQIASQLAKLRYRTAGEFFAPVTIRTPCGGGIRGGQTHSQSPEGLFTQICGIKVVMPSNPYDAKGLLISAIEDDDPVVFFEPKRIYNGPFDGDPDKPAVPWSTHPAGEVPEDYYSVPIGRAEVVRARRRSDDPVLRHHGARGAGGGAPGGSGRGDYRRAHDGAAGCGDLRQSVEKTGRCVIVHEATRFSGYGAELSATIQEECFYSLEAPIVRVCGWDTPYPHAFEWQYFPGQKRLVAAIEQGAGGRMSEYVFKLPDLGEGTVEAEIVAWHVAVGDQVEEGQVIVDVMTDKANVEVPAPVTGRVLRTSGAPGDLVAVGSELIALQTATAAAADSTGPAAPTARPRSTLKLNPTRRQLRSAEATVGSVSRGDRPGCRCRRGSTAA